MATDRHGTVVGVFTDHVEARHAVEDLRDHGFTVDQIGVAGRDWRDEGELATTMDTNFAEEGAATGVAAGAGAGLLWGLGIVAGVMPAIGPAIAGGTLAAILSSAVAGAAAAGIAGALVGMGIPKEDAEFYETEFHSGRIIVTVAAAGQESVAEEIIERHGGYNRNRAAHVTY